MQYHDNEETFCAMTLIEVDGKFLGVSRKDDHNDIGMPGGKSDPGESYEECAIRETLEETGYTVKLRDVPPYIGIGLRRTCVTFLADIVPVPKATIDPNETAIVGWFDKQAFLDGFSGEYNVGMFIHFGV